MIGDVICTRPDGSRFFVVSVRYVLKADTPGTIRVDHYANDCARGYAASGALTFEPGSTPVEIV